MARTFQTAKRFSPIINNKLIFPFIFPSFCIAPTPMILPAYKAAVGVTQIRLTRRRTNAPPPLASSNAMIHRGACLTPEPHYLTCL